MASKVGFLAYFLLASNLVLFATCWDFDYVDDFRYSREVADDRTQDITLKEAEAAKWLEENEPDFSGHCNKYALDRWDYTVNITDETQKRSIKALNEITEYTRDLQNYVVNHFPDWSKYKPPIKRQLRSFAIGGPGNMSKEHIEEQNTIQTKMETAYSAAKVCKFGETDPKTCKKFRLDPEITERLRNGFDYEELAYYWTAWHDVTSKAVPTSDYKRFMELTKESATARGYPNAKELWAVSYDDDEPDFSADKLLAELARNWDELRPHYDVIHAFVRMKLRELPEYKDKIPKDGCIPANLLGNMWGQEWVAVGNRTKPFPGVSIPDATAAMKAKGYTTMRMFEDANNFFKGLGLLEMTDNFWKKSMFERPSDGRDVVCHASSDDFCLGRNSTDFRIKMCATVCQEDLVTIHHEMGHIEYFMQYTNLPLNFRDGANPGFHEAIGDTLALSVTTPKHLQCVLGLPIGQDSLCDSKSKRSITITEQDINFLYLMALDKLAFFPFAYSMDMWRIGIYDGSITEDQYNQKWWQLRAKNQGIMPPYPRPMNSGGLDAAAKYHIAANVEYMRYFISHILQFQFYEAMCKAAGEYSDEADSKPLHLCDFSGSKAAGKLLGDMMKLGYSEPWPVAMEKITGERRMSTKAVIKYFKPLLDALKKMLQENNETIGFSCDV